MNRLLKYLALCLCGLIIALLVSVRAIPAIAHLTSPENAIAQSSAEQQVEQGRTFYRDGQYEEALATWEQALESFRQQSDVIGEAMVLSNIALVYRQQGDLVRAREAIANSLNLIEREDVADRAGRSRVFAQVLNTQGSLQLAGGQFQAALETWESAEVIYQQLDYQAGVIQSTINQTQALRALGFHQRAKTLLENLAEEISNNASDPSDLSASLEKIQMLRSLGEALRALGNLDGAQKQLQASLDIAQSRGADAELPAIHTSLGNIFRDLGDVALQQQQIAKAREDYSNARENYDRAFQLAPTRLEGIQAHLNQLNLLVELKQAPEMQDLWPDLAVQDLWSDLQSQLLQLPITYSNLAASINLAQTLIQFKQQSGDAHPSTESIKLILLQTLCRAKEMGNDRILSYTLGTLGHLYEAIAQDEDNADSENWVALPDTDAADLDLATVETPLAYAQLLTEKALGFANSAQAPEIAYRWHWQQGRLFKAQEQLKPALAAYEVAYQTVRYLRQDLFLASSDVRFNFRDNVEALYREYIDVLLKANNDPDLRELIRQRLQNANDNVSSGETNLIDLTPARLAKYTLTELQLADLENLLDCALSSFDSLQLDETVDAIAEDIEGAAAILYPIILDDRIEVLLKLPGQSIQQLNPIEIPKQKVEQILTEFRQELERPYFSSIRGRPKAQQIYDWLVRDAEETYLSQENIETLVFVLDGPLRNIPMAALHDGEAFLVQKYAIAVALGNLRLPRSQPSKQFRVLAAGVSDKPQFSEEENQDFGPLPFVTRELEDVGKIMDDTQILENKEFTQESLETALASGNYNVVHLATHGQFGISRENTFIVTGLSETSIPPGEKASGNDAEEDREPSKIDLNELDTIFRSRDRDPIELLVLSACETATGDSREVLGIAGLAVQTGARSTLASLWSISDASTAVLMKAFYQQLVTEKTSRAEALRDAQRQLLQNPAYKPSDWAAYILVGDWR